MKKIGRRNSQDGAAAVEMAIVLPILFLLVFGIIEFGFVFNRWISVTHAAREGARRLAVNPDTAAAISAAEATAPDLGSAVKCNSPGSPPPPSGVVQMQCSTPYELQLFIFKKNVVLKSTAQMKKE